MPRATSSLALLICSCVGEKFPLLLLVALLPAPPTRGVPTRSSWSIRNRWHEKARPLLGRAVLATPRRNLGLGVGDFAPQRAEAEERAADQRKGRRREAHLALT